jgi:lycopene beta-cyclase
MTAAAGGGAGISTGGRAVGGEAACAFDVVIVGGGLAGGLCALALRRRRPRLRVALIEAGPDLGGNHTWSFHDGDVDAEGAALLDPLVVRRWPAVEAAFPDHHRRLTTGYATITSASLAAAVKSAFATDGAGQGWQLLLGQKVAQVANDGVRLPDGRWLRADLVLDGRGPPPPPRWVENEGFQKFVGLEVELDARAPGPGSWPDPDTALVMDARVPQVDGFRFVYVLPLAPDRLLVEDTYYADDPTLDRDLLRARALAYLDQRGIAVRRVLREESGVLSIPFSDQSVPPLGSPVRLGARGGWFHPTTGYTLPLAVRVAGALAAHGPAGALPALAALHRTVQRQAAFGRLLNRLLFRASPPEARWQILSRFYRLPAACIARFYALDTSALDRARILLGRPPRGVSLRAAFAALQAA